MGKTIVVPKGYRALSPYDFETKGILTAIYAGESDCLDTGGTYTVQYIKKRNRLSVPVSLNPDIEPNYGREFTLGSFMIENEELKYANMIDDILSELKNAGNTEAIEIINKHLKSA